MKSLNPNVLKEGSGLKKFLLEELFEPPLLQPLAEGELAYSDEEIEFSDEESEGEGIGVGEASSADRVKLRHAFSEEIRKRGY